MRDIAPDTAWDMLLRAFRVLRQVKLHRVIGPATNLARMLDKLGVSLGGP